METKGASAFWLRHYAMTAADMAAHPQACELRAYCIARLESLAAEDEAERDPDWLRQKVGEWQRLF